MTKRKEPETSQVLNPTQILSEALKQFDESLKKPEDQDEIESQSSQEDNDSQESIKSNLSDEEWDKLFDNIIKPVIQNRINPDLVGFSSNWGVVNLTSFISEMLVNDGKTKHLRDLIEYLIKQDISELNLELYKEDFITNLFLTAFKSHNGEYNHQYFTILAEFLTTEKVDLILKSSDPDDNIKKICQNASQSTKSYNPNQKLELFLLRTKLNNDIDWPEIEVIIRDAFLNQIQFADITDYENNIKLSRIIAKKLSNEPANLLRNIIELLKTINADNQYKQDIVIDLFGEFLKAAHNNRELNSENIIILARLIPPTKAAEIFDEIKVIENGTEVPIWKASAKEVVRQLHSVIASLPFGGLLEKPTKHLDEFYQEEFELDSDVEEAREPRTSMESTHSGLSSISRLDSNSSGRSSNQ